MRDRIDKMSAGRVKIEMLPDGAIVGAFEILDAVDKGVVEAGYAWTHYWSGKHPAAGLFCNPMAGSGVGLDQLSHVAWLMKAAATSSTSKFYSDVLKVNVEPFMVQPMGPDPLGWFKTPINSVADFKKLKYRAPPGITGEIFKEMGVAAVALPGGEIVPAAQRGVIDAAEWIGPADDLNLGLQTVWKHYYLQGLHQSTDIGEILINKSVWDKLPPDLKEIIRTRGDGVDDGDLHVQRVPQRAGDRRSFKNEFKVEIHDTPKDFFPRVRARDQRRARPLRRQGRVLQAGARLAAQFREDRRPVLDQDPRSLLQPRQRGAAAASSVEMSPASRAAPERGRAPARIHIGSRERLPGDDRRASWIRSRARSDRVSPGSSCRWCSLVYEVFARYCFDAPTVWAYDMTFMLYGTFFMLGSAWTLAEEGPHPHRLVLRRLVAAPPGAVDLACYLLFFLPAMFVFLKLGWDYFWKSYSRTSGIVTSPWTADHLAVQVRDAADRARS